jgi:hypothetical protein
MERKAGERVGYGEKYEPFRQEKRIENGGITPISLLLRP